MNKKQQINQKYCGINSLKLLFNQLSSKKNSFQLNYKK